MEHIACLPVDLNMIAIYRDVGLLRNSEAWARRVFGVLQKQSQSPDLFFFTTVSRIITEDKSGLRCKSKRFAVLHIWHTYCLTLSSCQLSQSSKCDPSDVENFTNEWMPNSSARTHFKIHRRRWRKSHCRSYSNFSLMSNYTKI
jgi:hypothetical protein